MPADTPQSRSSSVTDNAYAHLEAQHCSSKEARHQRCLREEGHIVVAIYTTAAIAPATIASPEEIYYGAEG